MKNCLAIVVLLLLAGCASSGNQTLTDKLLDVSVDHIKSNGPDEDTALFMSVERHRAWERREEIAAETIPYLRSAEPNDVSGALAVLYRLRTYRPMNDFYGVYGSEWEHRYEPAAFWAMLDQHVFSSFAHVHAINYRRAYHNLALYLGAAPSDEAGAELLRIARETPETDQATICLAWHRDPNDMDALLPFMLEDPRASRSLPYHFRIAYGAAALPYLEKAASEAKFENAREQAEKELGLLKADLDSGSPTTAVGPAHVWFSERR